MLRAAGRGGAGRLDAILYRACGPGRFYVSEHESSFARGPDFPSCLDNLSRQVLHDVADGVYQLPRRQILRTFVAVIEAGLPLRDGQRRQPFACRVDLLADQKGRRSFDAQCPTNYLREGGATLHEALRGLADVIAARYEGESITDLMRELPKQPLMTSFSLGPAPGPQWASAAIVRRDGRYEACALGAPVSAPGKGPVESLERLERRLAGRGFGAPIATSREPVYAALDVPLQLKERPLVHRFFIAIAPHDGRTPHYAAYAPQAGIALRAKTLDDALDGMGEKLARAFRGKRYNDARLSLRETPILTAAKIA